MWTHSQLLPGGHCPASKEGEIYPKGGKIFGFQSNLHNFINILVSPNQAQYFSDAKRIRAIGGKGGDGCVSFLQLWCNERAGPDGGDGGHGGHVVFQASNDVRNFNHVGSILKAEEGERGSSKDCHGKNAKHSVIKVPIGTVIRNAQGLIVGDLGQADLMFVAARGGAGGKGNRFFTTDKETSPKVCEYGPSGEDLSYTLELRSMADVGLIGYPNAGKSTLLNALTRAKPKVAPYAFTTLRPHLGTVQYDDHVQLTIADLPGLVQQNPDSEAGEQTSVEFCGGTHLRRSGHIMDFVISSEEAIAKGIRRIVALTGPEALKALKKSEAFEQEIIRLKATIDADQSGKDSKSHVKEIVELTEQISHATIPYVKKDEMRNLLKGLKKTLDDKERALRAAVSVTVVERAKALCEANPQATVLVEQLEAFNNTKALDAALKQVRSQLPDAAAMFLSVDADSKKIFCLSSVPKSAVEKGLKANEWVQHVSATLGGKGGGKPESAQASGTNYEKVDEIVLLASKFAQSKLS